MTRTRERPHPTRTVHAEITDRLSSLMTARSAQIATYGPEFAALWATALASAQGGKLLRPCLVMGVFDGLRSSALPDATTRDAAMDLAAALEILHFSFLLHDDLIDDDLYRRGVLNLVGKLVATDSLDATRGSVLPHDDRRLHWARSSALLVGDLMLTIAHQVFARAQVPEPQRLRLLDLLDEAVTETVAGEYIDVGLADAQITPTLSTVLDMTRMKTATYTFELPLRMAAIIAGAGAITETRLGEIGRHLGVAFQLQDDLLSAFEHTASHGKDQFSDFREGKETALIACARMTNQWPDIERLLGAPDFSAASGIALQHLLQSSGARDVVEAMVEDRLRLAGQMLAVDDGVLTLEARHFVVSLMGQMEGRRS